MVIPPYLLVEHDPRHWRGQAFSDIGIRPAWGHILIIAAATQQFHCKNNKFTMRLFRQWSPDD